ncbi:MAG: D-alanyl-D-alanine carboxypeptidase, partial [Eubacteriales bacterium]|nr:D-alanyl-D-alanine carboxypeptidase [Eubacteriales bacterium]
RYRRKRQWCIRDRFYIYAQEINNENSSEVTSLPNDTLSLVAESAVLIDAKTGIVLYDKNMNQKNYPASTTKILTSLLALENINPTDILKASFNAVNNIGPGSSNMGLKENEEMSAENIIYGTLLKSANEACMVIAEFISGDIDAFVDIMNERAKKIGANNTHFANPDGYHNDNHYTTSYDMALIMKEAIKNEEFVKIISTKKHTIPKTNLSDERNLTNSNKLILEESPFYYENCVGGKTGFTDEAGNTLVSYAKKDDIELIAVVMKGKGTEIYNDSKKMFEYGFNEFSEKSIFEKSSFKETAPVVQNFKDKSIDLGKADLSAKSDISLNLPNSIEVSKIKQKINLDSNI